MAFHVEMRRGLRHARAFNLSEAELRRAVVEPWARGGPIALGDRLWELPASDVRVLAGPPLSPHELAHGQGWNRAQRTAHDVTRRFLHPAVTVPEVAVLAAPGARELALRLLEELGVRAVPWERVRAELLARARPAAAARGARPSAAAALLVVDGGAVRLFDAGLALGAFGPRAILASAGTGPLPAELREVAVLPLADAGARDLLAARLRVAPSPGAVRPS